MLEYNSLATLRKKSIERQNSNQKKSTYLSIIHDKNIIKDIDINRPNQDWVSNITYIRTKRDFLTWRVLQIYTAVGVGFALLAYAIVIAIVSSPFMEGIAELLYEND